MNAANPLSAYHRMANPAVQMITFALAYVAPPTLLFPMQNREAHLVLRCMEVTSTLDIVKTQTRLRKAMSPGWNPAQVSPTIEVLNVASIAFRVSALAKHEHFQCPSPCCAAARRLARQKQRSQHFRPTGQVRSIAHPPRRPQTDADHGQSIGLFQASKKNAIIRS